MYIPGPMGPTASPLVNRTYHRIRSNFMDKRVSDPDGLARLTIREGLHKLHADGMCWEEMGRNLNLSDPENLFAEVLEVGHAE